MFPHAGPRHAVEKDRRAEVYTEKTYTGCTEH